MYGLGIILTLIDATFARDYDREHRNDKSRCTLITAISYRAIEKTKKRMDKCLRDELRAATNFTIQLFK